MDGYSNIAGLTTLFSDNNIIESLPQILLWTALGLVGFAIIIHLPMLLYRRKHSYMLGYKPKRERLKKLSSPKLLFVGSSAMAFTADTKRISEELNIPAHNMAMHLGPGTNFVFNEVEPYLEKGDIVIFCTSYYAMYGAAYGNGKFIIEILEVLPSSIKYMDFKNLKLIPKGIRSTIRMNKDFYRNILKGINPFGPRNLFPDGFNEYGDYVIDEDDPFRLDISNERPLMHYRGKHTFDEGYAEIFKKYRERYRKLGVHFFILPPCYPTSHYPRFKERIAATNKWLKEISGLPFLGDGSDYVYPPEHFYDNVFHLREEGKPARTEEIIKHLRATGLFDKEN